VLKLKKKNSTLDLTAIILTYNEEKHIKRCILSIRKFVKKIIIIDSYSNDKTIQIAKKYKTKIYKHQFVNQSKQINWGIKNIKFTTKWLLRIDADEIFTDKLKDKLIVKLNDNRKKYNGITINRKIRFLNKDINFGGVSPHKTLRIWRKNKGYCEDAWMDEQMLVKGQIAHINEDLIDHNLNNLSWWINKHKLYAIREAKNYLLNKNNIKKKTISSDPSKINKYLKLKIYYNFPMYIRPFLLFIYNYFIKYGFLSSWQGLIFYSLQSFWYRMLVDINIAKQKKIKIKN
jgi:glycosyltransferase involved in cell wall biosynthesis